MEKWLCDVESSMIASLRKLAKAAFISYPEEQRNSWVLRQPAQLVIAVSQIYWCNGVEEALKVGAGQLELFKWVRMRVAAGMEHLGGRA